jgi:hypothetical protein
MREGVGLTNNLTYPYTTQQVSKPPSGDFDLQVLALEKNPPQAVGD